MAEHGGEDRCSCRSWPLMRCSGISSLCSLRPCWQFPLPSSSSCNKFLQTKTTLVQEVSQRLAVSRPEVSHSFKIESSC